jgi:hypothetical protein
MTHQRVPGIDDERAAACSPDLKFAVAGLSNGLADSEIIQRLE